MKYSIIIYLVLILLSCDNKRKDNEELIIKINSYKDKNGRYPVALSEVSVIGNYYCYYLCGPDFCIQYLSEDDLYYYNSYLGWDYLEGGADQFHCK